MSDDLTVALQRVFREVFQMHDLTLRPEMTAADVRGWDSLKHIELMMAIETAFKVRFKTAEVARFENVGGLLAKLRDKLARA
jgi:acyl carrier protein